VTPTRLLRSTTRHSWGIRRLLPTYIQRPEKRKSKQMEVLIEASGHFRSVLRRLCVKELRLGHTFNGLRRHRGPENLAHSFFQHLVPAGEEPCNTSTE
jgi:hypothetical protein